MQIQISWLRQKPTDLDLYCLLRQGMSCLAREGLNQIIQILQSRVMLLKNFEHTGNVSKSVYPDQTVPFKDLHCLLST